MERRWDHAGPTVTSPPGNQQMLPSIRDLAKGVPLNGHAGDSPPYHTEGHSVRDSGNWSMQTPPSKRSSVISSAPSQLQLPSLASHRTSSTGLFGASTDASGERSPFSATFSNVNGNGPTSAGPENQPRLAQINQSFDTSRPRSNNDFAQESRRSSIASGVGQLALQSPLASTNASQTSLATNLQRERGGGGSESARNSGYSSSGHPPPLPPTTRSIPNSGRKTQRTAPPIDPSRPKVWPGVHADNPTPGQPYAFPDPEMTKARPQPGGEQRLGTVEEDRAPSSHRTGRGGSMDGQSLSSSIFTHDSQSITPSSHAHARVPDSDDHSSPAEEDASMGLYASRSTSELDDIPHHHHQLHSKQLFGLVGTPDSPGAAPYSRTPELRVSHKLAERKRRSEMKTLFDDLRAQLPLDNRASKSSKWEILTRAIEHVQALTTAYESSLRQNESQREQISRIYLLQQDNKQLHEELNRMRQQCGQMEPHYHPGSTHQGSTQANGGTTTMPIRQASHPNLPLQGTTASQGRDAGGPMQGVTFQ